MVFKTPKDLLDPLERPLDLMTYLVKCCVAIPGDVLEIRDRKLFINDKQMTNPSGLKFLYHAVTAYPLQSYQLANFGLDSDDYWFSGYNKDKRTVYNMYLTEEQLKKIKKPPTWFQSKPDQVRPLGFPYFLKK